MTFMVPEISSVSSCAAPRSVEVKLKLVLSVSQADVCDVLELICRCRLLSPFE